MGKPGILSGLLALLVSLPAVAAEPGEGATSPFAGDIGNALWTLVIFALVVYVLGKFAWGPLLRGLQSRENFIRESLEKAQRQREEAEARLQEYEERLARARAEASAIVEEGRRDAEVLKRKIEEDARQEAQRILDRARREIDIATDTAVKELYSLAAGLATEIAARILRREINPQDHERLVSESLEELSRAAQN